MMKNKIDIGVFVKKVLESDKQSQQPDKKVLERIHETLDKPKTSKKKIFLWLLFPVLLSGLASYLFLDTISTGFQNEKEYNSVITHSKEKSKELSPGEFIGPKLFSDIHSTNEDTLTSGHTSVYYSIILDTIQPNRPNTISTKKGNTNYDIDKLFKQKTIYHYYRASDSLRIETTDKKVIDSILAIKNNQK